MKNPNVLSHLVFRTFIFTILSFSSAPVAACSIVGYLGNQPCKNFIMQGLARLEYRGYDSAGFACIDSATGHLVRIRAAGELQKLRIKTDATTVDGVCGIGHTRWATHGAATEENAHPHTDTQRGLAVVHNGIIENFFELKEQLKKEGCVFTSETDTEVIAHLMSKNLQSSVSLHEAVQKTVATLEGAYAFIVIMENDPQTLVVARKGSPLCLGLGKEEVFIASDFLAFAGKTDQVVFMPESTFALITREQVNLYDLKGNPLTYTVKEMKVEPAAYEKLGHEHYMLKEIYEQRQVIKKTVEHFRTITDSLWQRLGITADYARRLKTINIVGCGTSWHAARIAQFFFEHICKIPTRIYLGSEFRYMPFFPEDNSLYIAVSQSGETADTLEAVRLINAHNVPVISVTNVGSSSMVRETRGALLTKAGPEIAVASTKAFATQIAAFYWLAHCVGFQKGLVSLEQLEQAESDLIDAGTVLEETIEKYKLEIITTLAKKYASCQRFMFLGRHVVYPFAMEAALKLKEITYIFAQGYPAGELKHGSIALVDIETPVVLFSHLDPIIYKKLLANAQEVKARKGHLIVFAFEGQEELYSLADQLFVIPCVAPLLAPLAMTGLMQFFVYEIAKVLKRDIDKPRNLAKAVTVE